MTSKNIGKRILAGFIDYLIIYLFMFAFAYSFGEQNEEGGFSVTGILALMPFLFWFIITVLLESVYGATIGNSLVGLKPKSLISRNGDVSMSQSFKRHLLDPIDMCFFGLVGIIVIKNSNKNQRLGDLWANTIVVEIKSK